MESREDAGTDAKCSNLSENRPEATRGTAALGTGMEGDGRVDKNDDPSRAKGNKGLDQPHDRGGLEYVDVGCGPPTPIITCKPD